MEYGSNRKFIQNMHISESLNMQKREELYNLVLSMIIYLFMVMHSYMSFSTISFVQTINRDFGFGSFAFYAKY